MFVSCFKWSLAGLVVSSFALTSAVGASTPEKLQCADGASVIRSRLVPGVARYTCVQAPSVAAPVSVPDGQELLIAGARCSDGRQHMVQVERTFENGTQVGEEIGSVDGKIAYRLLLSDGRVAAVAVLENGQVLPRVSGGKKGQSANLIGWHATAGKARCMGLHLCGELVGYGECTTRSFHHRGAFVRGVADGPGERIHGDGSRHVGLFWAGDAHGKGVATSRKGVSTVATFLGGKAYGVGHTATFGGKIAWLLQTHDGQDWLHTWRINDGRDVDIVTDFARAALKRRGTHAAGLQVADAPVGYDHAVQYVRGNISAGRSVGFVDHGLLLTGDGGPQEDDEAIKPQSERKLPIPRR